MTNINRLVLIATLAFMGSMPFAHAKEDVSDYPSKSIKILLGAPPGGSTDGPLRVLAEEASEILGVPVVVENRPGVGGAMPSIEMQTTRPDGYTIGVLWTAVFRLPYTVGIDWDPVTDLSYIIGLTSFEFGSVVKAGSPFKTMDDYVNAAKASPEGLTYGTAGVGTIMHLTMQKIADRTGADLIHIPFNGSNEVLQSVMAGQVDLGADTTAWAPLVKSGKLDLIAVWGDTRLPGFPDVPTLKEQGYGIEQISRIGLVAPEGTDPVIINKLHDAFKQAMETPEYKKALAIYEMSPKYLSSEAFYQYAIEATEEEEEKMKMLGIERKK